MSSAKDRLQETLAEQDEKGRITDQAQAVEPLVGARASATGFAPRHERGHGEDSDAWNVHGHEHNEHGHEHEEGLHILPLKTYGTVFGALMVLLILTLAVYFFDFTKHIPASLGFLGIVIAMAIAIAKAVLVIMYFMHVKFSSKLTWLFSVTAFVFVGIMFLFTYADYLSRGILDTAGH